MRIAIFTLGTRGDVQPYLALAKHAVGKGHSTVICTGKSFKSFIVAEGIEFQEAESDLMSMLGSEEGRMIFDSAWRHPLKTKKYLNEVVNPAFRKTLDQFWKSAQGADVILYHPKAFGAPDIAIALGIPCISMPPVPITYPIEEFPNLAVSATKNFGKIINRLTYKLVAKAESASIKEVNDFREKTLKLPKRKSGLYSLKIGEKDIPIIYPLSSVLFPEVKSWAGKVYLPGFFYLYTSEEHIEDKLKIFLNEGAPPIVVSFSSISLKNPEKFKSNLVEAIKNTGNRAVVLTGNTGMVFKDENFIFSTSSAPHTFLFPRAKGIVHHGGVGTMATALLSGKPQLIIPFGVDQPFWANRLYNKGYCVKPLKEREISAEVLEQRFREMEKAVYVEKANEIKKVIDSENGAENAVKYIETICENYK